MTTHEFHNASSEMENIPEEEELIIAVNAIVVNVSNIIQQEIRNDANGLWTQLRVYIKSCFPILLECQQPTTGRVQVRWMQDLPKIVMLLLPWFIALWYLSPVHLWSSRERKEHGKNTRNKNNNNHGEEDENDAADKGNSSLSSYTNNDDETVTDEDLFEQLWETSIQHSAYSNLVLPPVCRYIALRPMVPTTPSNLLLLHHRRSQSTSNTAIPKPPALPGILLPVQTPLSKEDTVPTSQQEEIRLILSSVGSIKESVPTSSDDIGVPPSAHDNSNVIVADDDPILRLRRYLFEIYIFFRSIISFDYTTAGTTLFNWVDQLYKLHFQQQQQELELQLAPPNQSIIMPSEHEVNQYRIDESNFEKSSLVYSTPIIPTETTPTRFCGGRKNPDEEKKDEIIGRSSGLNRKLYTIPQSPMNEKAHQHEIDSIAVESKPTATQQIPSQKSIVSSSDIALEASDRDSVSQALPPINSSSIWMEPSKQHIQVPSWTGTPERRSMERFASDKYHYFDTITSNESLRQMSIDIPVPDKHGYILGDEFLIDQLRCTPLLVFVNSRSGPQQGNLLLTQLRRLLNPIQIWDLAVNGDPRIILESFLVFSKLRILVCGGDGTVAWIITTMEKMNISNQRQYPPISILPLGTGNDLSRILGWGGGYNNESLIVILEQISESYVSLLDQWEVTIDENKCGSNQKSNNIHHSPIKKGFFNYLGVGADAQAALQVHNLREIRPQWFFSRLVNKAMYGIFGAEDILKATTVNVRKDIQLYADGVRVPLPHDSQGIILLNIDSYAGGVPLWSHGVTPPSSSDNVDSVNSINRVRSFSEVELCHHHPIDKKYASQDVLSAMDRNNSIDDYDVRNQSTSTEDERYGEVTACNMPCSCQDGYLDIVSIRGAFHLGQIKVGLSNAQRLCQCREATIVIRNKVAVQVDGEPWRQNTCTINIRRKQEQAVMLHRSADDGGVETEMSKLLEWAESRKMIDCHVHTLLMKEFSRRIESKTRQRRAAAVARQHHDNFMHFTSTIKKAISSNAMA